ncbi:MAG TPA: amidase [Arthrobacter sp.]|nr:amidase [Arthrobacter sp.]
MHAIAERVEIVNPAINALCTLDIEQALSRAREIDESRPTSSEAGPLLGVPVSIKDLTETAGLLTTYGAREHSRNIPRHDAEVVKRIREAGAVIFAKSNTPEWGVGINTRNHVFGQTRNPWRVDRSAGGSSGGAAAAVASGLGPLAEATDHGCSIRLPSSFNGVVGLRPTAGRVPKWPNGWVYDPYAVTGPMARSVEDCELLLRVMSGPDRRVPPSDVPLYRSPDFSQWPDLANWKIGWSPDLGIAPVDTDVLDVCTGAVKAFEDAGVRVDTVAPGFDGIREIINPLRAVRQVAQEQAKQESTTNELVLDFLRAAPEFSAVDVGRAEAARSHLWQRMASFFDNHDFLVTVSTQTAAFPIADPFPKTISGQRIEDTIEACLTCYAITMTGLPAISVPAGLTKDGLPVGLQIVGPRFSEASVLMAAKVLQTLRPWSHLRPAVDAT